MSDAFDDTFADILATRPVRAKRTREASPTASHATRDTPPTSLLADDAKEARQLLDDPSTWFAAGPTANECIALFTWDEVRAFLEMTYGAAFTTKKSVIKVCFTEKDVESLEHNLSLVRKNALKNTITDPSLPMIQRIFAALKQRASENKTAVLFEGKERKVNHWCTSVEAHNKFYSRHVKVPYFAELMDLQLGKGVVTIVTGESGSGKTCAMLNCLNDMVFGVYVTPDDIKGWEDADFSRAVDPTTKDRRNTKVCEALKSTVERLVGDELKQMIHGSEMPLTIVIAIDEVGSLPNFVRGLCASVDTVAVRLAGLLGQHCSFSIVAAGTGADANASAPGSYPPNFSVVGMPTSSAEDAEELIFAEVKKNVPRHLRAALEDSAEAHELCRNPRVAACVYHQWKTVLHPHIKMTTNRTAAAVVPVLLLAAAQMYKSLNGMMSVTEDEVQRIYADALLLLFARDPNVILSAAHTTLIRSYGVLTDSARWAKGEPPLSDVVIAREGELVLSSPRDRFRMSEAQSILFRMNYGYAALRNESWCVYETTIAQHLEAALIGCRGRSVSHLLSFLAGAERIEQLGKESNKAGSALSEKLSVTKVVSMVSWTKHSPQVVNAETTEVQLADVRSHLDRGSVVVLVNAPQSAFADVIVLVKETLLLLVQCKFYGDSTPLNEEALDDELAKMEQIAVLKHVAGISDGKGIAVRVLACTKPPPNNFSSWRCSEKLLWWETSKDRGLAPLATHVPRAIKEGMRRTVVAELKTGLVSEAKRSCGAC